MTSRWGWGRWPEPAFAAGGPTGPGSPMGGAQIDRDSQDVSSLAEQIGPDHKVGTEIGPPSVTKDYSNG